MNTGTWALLIAVAAAVVFGLLWRSRQGKARTKRGTGEEVLVDQMPEGLRRRLAEASDDDAEVTLLQLSTTFCAPCRHARILLTDFAERTEGVRHVEIDLTNHPEWSTPLRVHTTPTTLALDSTGRELFRVGGVPRRDALAATLRAHLR
ncbi:TlpA family protein disulfide reductase [Saccharopolyspora phatthalungensis]|uniref:Thiol-disulfide isomerase/thioredoxin n=1 Tax=Saccharopolyspora phatthalungensis TaxID=664693 RepID=A0A840Q4G7_9PSEU|nr:thioredoxin family protein [Saccharopolyspora phatthalungensis]MBB5154541.1 thiol-disulfide isomerase/thioredoxin [Saccharopolyspora phatthalungensis]